MLELTLAAFHSLEPSDSSLMAIEEIHDGTVKITQLL
jgi:hypothetical protein